MEHGLSFGSLGLTERLKPGVAYAKEGAAPGIPCLARQSLPLSQRGFACALRITATMECNADEPQRCGEQQGEA